MPPLTSIKGKTSEPPKVRLLPSKLSINSHLIDSYCPFQVAEVKQQIKLTLKSTVPQLKKVANKFNDDSDDEGALTDDIHFSLHQLSFYTWIFPFYRSDPLAWEKSAPSDIPPLTPVTSQNQLSRKRAAESPPPATPPSKVFKFDLSWPSIFQ